LSKGNKKIKGCPDGQPQNQKPFQYGISTRRNIIIIITRIALLFHRNLFKEISVRLYELQQRGMYHKDRGNNYPHSPYFFMEVYHVKTAK